MTDEETVLEQSEDLNGCIHQTVRLADGSEVDRVLQYTCSICGAHSARPFPTSAISCFRPECKDGQS
jgi:hypothetical protein